MGKNLAFTRGLRSNQRRARQVQSGSASGPEAPQQMVKVRLTGQTELRPFYHKGGRLGAYNGNFIGSEYKTIRTCNSIIHHTPFVIE